MGAQRPNEVVDFAQRDPRFEANGAEPVPGKPAGKVTQEGIARIGRLAVREKLAVPDAERHRFARFEQSLQAAGETGGGLLELRVPVRVHPAAVKHDRELDQELGDLPRKRGSDLAATSGCRLGPRRDRRERGVVGGSKNRQEVGMLELSREVDFPEQPVRAEGGGTQSGADDRGFGGGRGNRLGRRQ